MPDVNATSQVQCGTRGAYTLVPIARRLLVAAAVTASQGCMTLPPPVTVTNPDDAGKTHFDGMRKILNEPRGLRILVVHGMRPHEIGYSNELQRHLASELQLSRDPLCSVIDTFTSAYGTRSYVRRCLYTTARDTVRIYELTWSELSQTFVKQRLAYDWTQHGKERVLINRLLKKELVDRAFSDAIIYTGEFAPTMQQAVAHALCAMMLDGLTGQARTGGCTFAPAANVIGANGHPIVLISHSLGSMMVFETIKKLLEDTSIEGRAAQVTAKEFLRQLRLVAMLANQLPLLDLARISPEPGQATGMLEFLRGESARFPIVAVSDPNDLLTFPLPPRWSPDSGVRVINVRMANANAVALATAVNPGRAHSGYFDNPCVTRLLVQGSARCSVVPIGGLHYQNPGRLQIDAGVLFRARSRISLPVYASLGAASGGLTTAIAARHGSIVVQARPSILRTWGRPVGALRDETYAGVGLRVSAFTITVGIDELWNVRTHRAGSRVSVGTGW